MSADLRYLVSIVESYHGYGGDNPPPILCWKGANFTFPVLLIIVSYVIHSERKICKRVGSEIYKIAPTSCNDFWSNSYFSMCYIRQWNSYRPTHIYPL